MATANAALPGQPKVQTELLIGQKLLPMIAAVKGQSATQHSRFPCVWNAFSGIVPSTTKEFTQSTGWAHALDGGARQGTASGMRLARPPRLDTVVSGG